MAARENRFAPELNEKEIVELLKNATPGNIKKATKYGMKIYQGRAANNFPAGAGQTYFGSDISHFCPDKHR